MRKTFQEWLESSPMIKDFRSSRNSLDEEDLLLAWEAGRDSVDIDQILADIEREKSEW